MALRKRYDVRDNDIEKLVPVLAATRLYERALDVPKLSPGNGIERSVIKLARKHNVPIRKTEVKIEGSLLASRGCMSVRGARFS